MKIKSYTFAPAQIAAENQAGGFNADTKKIKAFEEFTYVHEVLDVMTAAAEAGVLNREKWVSQLFSNDEVFDEFLENLSDYDDCYRIHDRWYQALLRITGLLDEEGFVRSDEIAEELRKSAEKTNQL